MKNKHYPSYIPVWILSILWASCTLRSEDGKQDGLPPTKQQAASAVQVRTAVAVRKPFAFQVLSVGKIEAQQHSEIFAKREGILTRLYVKNGQLVQKGTLIASLDKTELELQVRKAEANLALRRVQYQDKVIEHNHTLNSDAELSEELRQRFRATSGLAEAEIALQDAKLNLSYTQILAPFAGIVADLKMKEGNRLSPTQPLCLLYSHQALDAVVEILESQATRLAVGQEATLTPLHDEAIHYQARISEINPKVTSNGLVRVKLAIAPPSAPRTPLLLQGMNIRVRITAPQAEAIVVPKEAIVMRSGRKVVFTVQNNEAKWHYVSTGAENQTEVAITEGLTAGAQVIISNNVQLMHDSPVQVIK